MYRAYYNRMKLLGRRFVLTSNTTHYNSEDIQRILTFGHKHGPKLAQRIHDIQVLYEKGLGNRGWIDHMHTCVAGCYRIRRDPQRESYAVSIKYSQKGDEITLRSPSSSLFELTVPKLANWVNSEEECIAVLGGSQVVLPRSAHRHLIYALLQWNISDSVSRHIVCFLTGTCPNREVPGDEVTEAHDKMVDLRLRFLEEAEALGPIRIHSAANKVSQAEKIALNVEKMQTVAEETDLHLMRGCNYLNKTVNALLRLKKTLPPETWQFEELLTTTIQMRKELQKSQNQVKPHYESLSAHPFTEDTE